MQRGESSNFTVIMASQASMFRFLRRQSQSEPETSVAGEKRKESTDNNSEDDHSEQACISDTNTPAQKKLKARLKFQEKWRKDFQWLRTE